MSNTGKYAKMLLHFNKNEVLRVDLSRRAGTSRGKVLCSIPGKGRNMRKGKKAEKKEKRNDPIWS